MYKLRMEAAMSSFSFSLDKSIIIQAGAGAGKTTTLTRWFLELSREFKKRHDKYPKVIITTFTRKATQEVRERLMLKAMEENETKILENLTKKSQVHISTIHGVLSLFLSRYADRIGLGAEFKLIDEIQHRRILKKILRKDIENDPDLLKLMDSFDLSHIESILIKFYEAKSIYPDLSFVSKEFQLKLAKDELIAKIKSFHNILKEILKSAPPEEWCNYFSVFLNLSLTDFENIKSTWIAIRENSKSPRFMKKNPPFAEEYKIEIDEYLKRIDALVEDSASTEVYLNRLEELHQVFEKYAEKFLGQLDQIKTQMQVMTMSDLELYSLKIIRNFPEIAKVFSQEWDYWMIDEYQDTSPLQVEILKGLVGDTKSFTVGDPQQSIYLFRGARTEVFSQKVESLISQGQDFVEMMVNYRSRDSILNFINFTFSKISNSFGHMSFDDTAWADRPPIFLNSPSLRRVLGVDENSENEVELALAEISDLIKLGQKPENICVLSRKNSWLEKLATRAYQVGIDVQIHSNSQFFDRREIVDSLSLLKVILNPHDNKNLLVWLRSPWMALSDAEIVEWTQGRSMSYWNNLINHEFAKNRSQTVHFLFELYEKSKVVGVLEVFKEALIQFQMLDYSLKIDPTGRREANLWKLVHWLSEEERRPGFNFISFIDRASTSIDLENGSDESDANPVLLPSRVHLMTIHASKGLQFDSIIVLGTGDAPQVSRSSILSVSETEKIFSLSLIDEETGQSQASILAKSEREKFNHRELDENLRTLYVGLTRAVSTISFIHPIKIQKLSWYEILDFYHPRWENAKTHGFEIETVRHSCVESNLKKKGEHFAQVYEPLIQETIESENKKSVTALISGQISNEKMKSQIQINDRAEMIKVAQQGTEAHRMFEALKMHSITKVQTIWNTENQLKMLKYIMEFSEFSLIDLIHNGQVEWGYIYKKNNQIIQGQIDLWGRINSEVWIVDYKTGSSRYKDKAFEQLNFYHEALAITQQLKKEDKVKLLAIYPLEEKYFIQDGLQI